MKLKYRIIKDFHGIKENKNFYIDDIVEFSEDRANEILEVDNFILLAEDEKPIKKTKENKKK